MQQTRVGKLEVILPPPLAGSVSSLAMSFEERSLLLEIGTHFLNNLFFQFKLNQDPRQRKQTNPRLCDKKFATPSSGGK